MAEGREPGGQVRAVPWKRREGAAGQGRGELCLGILENYWVLDSEGAGGQGGVGSMEFSSTPVLSPPGFISASLCRRQGWRGIIFIQDTVEHLPVCQAPF